MPPLLVGIGLFVVWMVSWAALYQYRLHRLKVIEDRFEASLTTRHQTDAEYRWLQRRSAEFKQLMNAAHVPDSTIPYAEPVGGGFVSTGNASTLENWLALRADTVQWTRRAIEQARGVYEDRRLRSLNPLYWLWVLLTLPQQAVRWVGGNPDGSLSRALTVVWWIIVAIGVIAGIVGVDLLSLLGKP